MPGQSDSNFEIERYLRGTLPDEQRDAFELRYLEHSHVLDELELTRALQRGLQANAEVLRGGRPQPLQRLWRMTATPQWRVISSLAAVMFAVTSAALIFSAGQKGPGLSQAVTQEIALMRVRGISPDRPAVPMPEDGLLLISIDVAGLDEPIDAALYWENERAPLSHLTLLPDADGLAIVALPAEALRTGAYTVLATGSTGSTIRYSFELQRP